jgi:hypothetical protein
MSLGPKVKNSWLLKLCCLKYRRAQWAAELDFGVVGMCEDVRGIHEVVSGGSLDPQ